MGDANLDLDLRLFSDSEFSDKEDDGSNTDEDSDKEHNTNMTRLCAALLVRRLKRRKQQPKTRLQIDQPRSRRKAKMLLQEGINDGLFRSEYRMSPQSFKKLVELLRNDLEPKDTLKKKTGRNTLIQRPR
jgi:hypothetical protein